MRYKSIALTIIGFFYANVLMAQSGGPDFFRSIGKIYVVVAVMVATFIGIVIFLVYLDRKIKSIEDEISSHD
ncbi:CcmD family protein [Portibacter marinus]|uniref:CcmD family protein n=1 Tax=Portibacter marinus TaxID=2898660 RepID=UPI001F2D0882|nr:CcmD family protein [Portibacter marinus]